MHWMVNCLQFLRQLNFVWRHTKVFIQNSSQDVFEMYNCWERRWIDVDGASHALSATATIFSGVRAVFGPSRVGLSMRMLFLSLFFHKITNIRNWWCFSSYKIRTQFSHTFCNITMIFKIMSQYFPALFKRIHNHIRSKEG